MSTSTEVQKDKYRFGVHPEYAENLSDWEAMEDAYEGEENVKRKSNGVTYLPFTPSQKLDGTTENRIPANNRMRLIFFT